jgi:hypothetical protein
VRQRPLPACRRGRSGGSDLKGLPAPKGLDAPGSNKSIVMPSISNDFQLRSEAPVFRPGCTIVFVPDIVPTSPPPLPWFR